MLLHHCDAQSQKSFIILAMNDHKNAVHATQHLQDIKNQINVYRNA